LNSDLQPQTRYLDIFNNFSHDLDVVQNTHSGSGPKSIPRNILQKWPICSAKFSKVADLQFKILSSGRFAVHILERRFGDRRICGRYLDMFNNFSHDLAPLPHAIMFHLYQDTLLQEGASTLNFDLQAPTRYLDIFNNFSHDWDVV
jgi:hypothetical protein